jgi:hypothetical protein
VKAIVLSVLLAHCIPCELFDHPGTNPTLWVLFVEPSHVVEGMEQITVFPSKDACEDEIRLRHDYGVGTTKTGKWSCVRYRAD